MPHRFTIVGTAGHIDHGKSTLIHALTGKETDTLEEEKRRGISINLGFTYFDLPNGDRVGIIDVPGHERFVKNMMSGVVGIDIVLLVVAADDGVMPQTLEHAEILTYMGIKDAIIVVTKCDMVEEDLLELVKEDIRGSLQGTLFGKAPMVCVDSLSGRGLPELIQLIQDHSRKVEDQPVANMPARLNVDRSFTIQGHGTVITGTLLEGEIYKNRTYMLYPEEREVKVRSIQVHGQDEEVAEQGQRTALNLANIKKEEIRRGDIIAEPGSLTATDCIDVRLSLSPHSPIDLRHWSRVRLFHGTQEIFARVVPLEKPVLKAGEEGLVQLRLEETIYCKREDPFVIRSYSPVVTIGGGRIIESKSHKHTIHDQDYVRELENQEDYDLPTLLETTIDQSDWGYEFSELYAYLGLPEEEIQAALDRLVEEGKLVNSQGIYFSRRLVDQLADRMKKILKKFHKENPLEEGMAQEAFRQAVAPKMDSKTFTVLLNDSEIAKHVAHEKGLVRLTTFHIAWDNTATALQEEMKDRVAQAEPKLLKDSDFPSKEEKKVLSYLLKKDWMILDGFIIRRPFYAEIQKKLQDFLQKEETIDLAQFRDLTGMSRKMALALLEDFDRKRVTKREGDCRRLFQ